MSWQDLVTKTLHSLFLLVITVLPLIFWFMWIWAVQGLSSGNPSADQGNILAIGILAGFAQIIFAIFGGATIHEIWDQGSSKKQRIEPEDV